jgi:small-conductance mechanosensitive channel
MQIAVWVLATLIVFDKIGVAITPFLTSLGI